MMVIIIIIIIIRFMSLLRADHSSGGVILRVVFLSMIVQSR